MKPRKPTLVEIMAEFIDSDPALAKGRRVLVGALTSQEGIEVTDVGQGLGAVDLVFSLDGRRYEVTLRALPPEPTEH